MTDLGVAHLPLGQTDRQATGRQLAGIALFQFVKKRRFGGVYRIISGFLATAKTVQNQ